jgi:hypothetical protein
MKTYIEFPEPQLQEVEFAVEHERAHDAHRLGSELDLVPDMGRNPLVACVLRAT